MADSVSLALATINHQLGLMQQCLSDGNLMQALKHVVNFLNELRTLSLTPKQYYEVYMAVFDKLEIVSQYLISYQETHPKKNVLDQLYELVQYAANIVPRLYLMVVVGTTYMAVPGAPITDIMKDLIEMCKGVQHPIRGLFLRYYLSQRTKNLLPVKTTDEFRATIDFLVANFIEMNKLWVRLQHQGHSSEREQRVRERNELKILVGSQLVRISQVIDEIDGDSSLAISYYRDKIFPITTQQIIACRDALAQSYLVDVLIQIFPEEFHFATLDRFLAVLLQVHPSLNKGDLVASIVDRFIHYHRDEDIADKLEQMTLTDELKGELFDVFWDFYQQLFELDPDMTPQEHLRILAATIQILLAFDVDPVKKDHLSKIYQFAGEHLPPSQLVELLVAPIEYLSSPGELEGSTFQHSLFSHLDEKNQRRMATAVSAKVLELACPLSTPETIDGVFQYLGGLVSESPVTTTSSDLGITPTIKIGEADVPQLFLSSMEQLSKVVNLIEGTTPLETVSLLQYVRRVWLNKLKQNLGYTYPPLVQKILFQLQVIGLAVAKLPEQFRQKHLSLLRSLFKQVLVVLNELSVAHPELLVKVLRLYVDAATVADNVNCGDVGVEFVNLAMVVYEEGLAVGHTGNYYAQVSPHDALGGSLAPYMLVITIANAVAATRNFDHDQYQQVAAQVTLYALRLLRKQDQCRGVYSCAHLWWWIDGDYHNGARVIECLQKSLRVADTCMDPYLSLKLFIEVLNRSLVFAVAGVPEVDVEFINGLLLLVRDNIDELAADRLNRESGDTEAVLFTISKKIFTRLSQYIVDQQDEGRLIGVMV